MAASDICPTTGRNAELGVTSNATDLRQASVALFGDAVAHLYPWLDRINDRVFDGRLRSNRALLIGLTTHGRFLGFYATDTGHVTLHPSTLHPIGASVWGKPRKRYGLRFAVDVLLHELVHAWQHEVLGVDPRLELGGDSIHNTPSWCETIQMATERLSLPPIRAEPVRVRRLPKGDGGNVVRRSRLGFLSRADIAAWPHSIRLPSYYTPNDEPIL
ncbi:MAG: hypothetical protein ABIP94_07535 [Planctomycetota bacterium]